MATELATVQMRIGGVITSHTVNEGGRDREGATRKIGVTPGEREREIKVFGHRSTSKVVAVEGEEGGLVKTNENVPS